MHADLDTERRLHMLESRLRRQRNWLVLMASAFALTALAALSPAGSEVLAAQRLEIRGSDGGLAGYFGFPPEELQGEFLGGLGLGWYVRLPNDRAWARLTLNKQEGGGSFPVLEMEGMDAKDEAWSLARMLASENGSGFQAAWNDEREALMHAGPGATSLRLRAGEPVEASRGELLLELQDDQPSVHGRTGARETVFELPE